MPSSRLCPDLAVQCHHHEQYRINASRHPLLAGNDTMDRWFGNCVLYDCCSSDFWYGRYPVFAAEASGPTHDKVHPRIGVTAKWIWGIYAGMTGTLIILLVFGGMGLFDSICHAFTTTDAADSLLNKQALNIITRLT